MRHSSSEALAVQNPALGAVAIWQFARSYFDTLEQVRGPELPEAMLVVPVVFHRRSAMAISRMQSSSGLSKALMDYPELTAGLQHRLEGFADVSFASLDLAVASGLIQTDPDTPWPRYIPGPKTMPHSAAGSSDDVKAIVSAAKRLGWWLARENFIAVCSLLNVRF